MEYEYIIEVTLPSTGEIYYLSLYNDLTKNPQRAMRFRKNSEEVECKLNHISRNLNPRIVDRRQIIGTYISTYKGKYTFKKIMDKIVEDNFLIIITLPVVLPIVLLITAKRELENLYNKYVTNDR